VTPIAQSRGLAGSRVIVEQHHFAATGQAHRGGFTFRGVLLYLASVTLVAAATIVLFGVAFISLLGTSKETLTGSRIDNNSIEDTYLGTVFFYRGNSAGPVPFQKKSPSLTEETQMNESTGSYGSVASPRSHPPLRHAVSRRPGVVPADRDNIAKKLNRVELSRLLEGKRALSRAPLR